MIQRQGGGGDRKRHLFGAQGIGRARQASNIREQRQEPVRRRKMRAVERRPATPPQTAGAGLHD